MTNNKYNSNKIQQQIHRHKNMTANTKIHQNQKPDTKNKHTTANSKKPHKNDRNPPQKNNRKAKN